MALRPRGAIFISAMHRRSLLRASLLVSGLALAPSARSAQTSVAAPKDSLFEKGVGAASSRVDRRQLFGFVEERTWEFDMIPAERKAELQELSTMIRKMKASRRPVKLTFICTGNSRRSQLAQVWASTAAAFYGISGIETYSGGTVVTAFNRRIAGTLTGAGFAVESQPGKNADFRVRYSDREEPIICRSKHYTDAANPKSEFIAVMLCSDADARCPVVPGSEFRVFIPYIDPREADHTEEERETYRERNMQIAREMLYVMSRVK